MVRCIRSPRTMMLVTPVRKSGAGEQQAFILVGVKRALTVAAAFGDDAERVRQPVWEIGQVVEAEHVSCVGRDIDVLRCTWR